MMQVEYTLPVLSIWQPWIYSILRLGKRIENRSYPVPHGYTGRVWLHSCMTRKDVAEFEAIFRKRLGNQEFCVGEPHEDKNILIFDEFDSAATFGAILGFADIIGCVNGSEGMNGYLNANPNQCRDNIEKWFVGPYGWILGNVNELVEPVMWKGTQGFKPNTKHTINVKVV